MIRNCSLEEISDGKLYGENDMVRADTGNCEGCSLVCCHGMGKTIVLDPYDVHRLTDALHIPFEELLREQLELNYVDGIMLPNLKMEPSTQDCVFLNTAKRCTIHAARPSVCRLFPLGRYWEDETHFQYILQTGQCRKPGLAKIKVKKWLDTENLEEYNHYVVRWHCYVKRVSAAVAKIAAADGCDSAEASSHLQQTAATQIKTICMFTLKTFYMEPYQSADGFFKEFEKRIETAYKALGMD